MARVLAQTLTICTALLGVAAQDQTISGAGVSVHVRGQSGKMTLTIPGADPANPDEVWVQMAAMRQLDSSGVVLGSGSSTKHSFNSFATQSFTFGPATQSTYQGLSVSQIDFDSVMVGTSTLKVSTYIFLQNGTLTVGSDTFNVTAGAVKFNVNMSSWQWCGDTGVTCVNQDGVGASVELDIDMYKVGAPAPQATGNGAYDLGGGQELMMLATYSQDDGATWTPMPTGFPSMSGTTFTLKFPRWSGSSVTYDPIVQYGSAALTPTATPASTSGAQSLAFSLVIMSLLLFLA